MVNVAVILSGCGHLDGAEIRESILTLLALDKADATVQCFAPDILQHHVVNHITQDVQPNETRHVLTEAARIARGDVKPLSALDSTAYDALIIPGGFGAAKNLSNLAIEQNNPTVLPAFKNIILAFLDQKNRLEPFVLHPPY